MTCWPQRQSLFKTPLKVLGRFPKTNVNLYDSLSELCVPSSSFDHTWLWSEMFFHHFFKDTSLKFKCFVEVDIFLLCGMSFVFSVFSLNHLAKMLAMTCKRPRWPHMSRVFMWNEWVFIGLYWKIMLSCPAMLSIFLFNTKNKSG